MSANPKIVQTLPSGKKTFSFCVWIVQKTHQDDTKTIWSPWQPYNKPLQVCWVWQDLLFSLHLNQHLTVNHNGKYNCGECGKHFEICTSLYNHLKIHRDIIYCCQHKGCNYRERSESRYKEHVKYYHLSTKNC